MRIEVDGIEYGNFVGASTVLRLDALSSTFAFEATSKDGLPLPFKLGQACKVVVDGDSVLSGFIELINVEGDSTSHKIDVQGRDKLGDLLDSTLGTGSGVSDIRPPVSLANAIRRVISHLGIQNVNVVDRVRPALFSTAEDLAAPEPGQNAFEFIEKLARKRQVLLTSDADGNVVIDSGSGVEVGASLQHLIGDDTNNVSSYSVSYDSTGRFNVYKSVSQMNVIPINLAGIVGVNTIISQGSDRAEVDSAIRVGRQHVLVSESMSSGSEDQRRAKWEKKIRAARGKVYAAVVSGYRNQTGNLWAINEIVTVEDEFADISAKMLVNSVTFVLGKDGGSTTSLSLIERNAYSIALEEPVADEVGEEFSLGDF